MRLHAYPTLYLQDGMSVLDCDPRSNDLKAGADSWGEKLAGEGMMEEIILVAVDSVEGRDQEYSPAIRVETYADFVCSRIKPHVDQTYRTLPDAANTGVAGWSLGAFIALYMAWKRPDVFGKAACLSTCFFDCGTADDGDMVLRTYRDMIYSTDFSPSLRMYYDYGTSEHIDGDISQWATQHLSELLVKGFVLDDERIKAGRTIGGDYFDELLARIRDIRASERLFYQKITDIYATSIDYDPHANLTQNFFATVQNKLHWAIHGLTAAELVQKRADASQPATQKVDFRFLRYWLNSPIMASHIHGYRDGTVAERLNLPTIRALPVLCPPVSEQREIAHILRTLDDKIELNRRMTRACRAV
jgi:pimeloyl-ACP methyl ester carboxylesterase